MTSRAAGLVVAASLVGLMQSSSAADAIKVPPLWAMFANGRVWGDHTPLTVTSRIAHPFELFVRATSTRAHPFVVRWSDTCRKGSVTATRSGQFRSRGRGRLIQIAHGLWHPDSCTVAERAWSGATGSLQLSLWTHYCGRPYLPPCRRR